MVPNTLHPKVAECCIANGAHLLTTSYVSPDLAALDGPAKEAGVILMNECGLDPGIDHMLAMECIDETHNNDGEVCTYVCVCVCMYIRVHTYVHVRMYVCMYM